MTDTINATTTDDANADSPLDEGAAAGSTAKPAYADFGDVRADRVEINQGSAKQVDAQTVTIQQGGAGSVRAAHLSLTQGGIALARADRLEVAEGGGAMAVLADEATVQPGGRVMVLIARTTNGDIRPLVDTRTAAAIGAGLVLAALILRRRR